MSTASLQQQVLGPALAASLWSWATYVFEPARRMKRMGLYHPDTLGRLPAPRFDLSTRGGLLSAERSEPVLLDHAPENYESVTEFDNCSGEYDAVVSPFSNPIYEETVALMQPHLTEDARILDPSCGPGNTAVRLSRLVPRGEVVGADLSRGMVERAHANAREAKRANMAFFQADVANPPPQFEAHFDVIFCCLSFHHYPDAPGAARAFHRVLRPGGVAFIADGGPQWFVQLARGISKIADPGFIQHRTGQEFMSLFEGAGFSEFHWVEALPGIGVSIAQK
jgi:ubiquinone/menaquinone biosynthesis C-methylase UbiE